MRPTRAADGVDNKSKSGADWLWYTRTVDRSRLEDAKTYDMQVGLKRDGMKKAFVGRKVTAAIAGVLVSGIVICATLMGSASAIAQDQPPATPAPAVADPVAAGQVTADDVNNVARELWCPLCSGVRLDACELKACDQMKDVIAIKLSEGEDPQSITDYFVEQYGPQVLGRPTYAGWDLFAWILPVLAVVGGGVFLAVRARGMMGRRSDDAHTSEGLADNETGESGHSVQTAPPELSAMEKKLNEELSRYD
jgi:cytochrome c-type biogenesis protein CcmH